MEMEIEEVYKDKDAEERNRLIEKQLDEVIKITIERIHALHKALPLEAKNSDKIYLSNTKALSTLLKIKKSLQPKNKKANNDSGDYTEMLKRIIAEEKMQEEGREEELLKRQEEEQQQEEAEEKAAEANIETVKNVDGIIDATFWRIKEVQEIYPVDSSQANRMYKNYTSVLNLLFKVKDIIYSVFNLKEELISLPYDFSLAG